MSLRIFNVLGREKQPFEPLQEGRVSMYVCGPTVYDHAHLGHAKTYVSFDVVVRYLRYSGYDVLYVQNLTVTDHLTNHSPSISMTFAPLVFVGSTVTMSVISRSPEKTRFSPKHVSYPPNPWQSRKCTRAATLRICGRSM